MRKFTLVFIASALIFTSLFFINACRKTEQKASDTENESAFALRQKFFVIQPGTHPAVTAIAENIKRQDKQNDFVPGLSGRAGFPLWQKARMFTGENNGNTLAKTGSELDFGGLIVIPFIKEEQNVTNALLFARVEEEDTVFMLLYASQYVDYGFVNDDPTQATAKNIFHLFSLFDNDIFGYTQFIVKDRRILTGNSADTTGEVMVTLTDEEEPGAENLTISFSYCNTYEICELCGFKGGQQNEGQKSSSMAECRCGSYFQTFCTTFYYITFEPGDGGEGGGGGGGGVYNGGGGGGSNGSGNNPPWYDENPCTGAGSENNPVPCLGNGNDGWGPVKEIDQSVADEQEENLSDDDPELIWWDANTSDPNTDYYTQTKPTFDNMNTNYPKNSAGTDDMPVSDVCTLIGGEVLTKYNNGDIRNACALRVSRGLNYSGVDIPNITGQTWQGSDGKNYFYYAQHLYNWMTKTFGDPDIHLTETDGAPNGTKFKDKLLGIQNRGIYIMKPKSQAAFGASGHATLWGGLDCVGGHNYFAAASDVYIWKLN